LRAELESLARYCSSEERAVQSHWARLIDQRDDLDFHAIHQGRLKGWLFVHLGLTYALMLVTAVHLVLTHAFRGS
jgi:hypothetical protein